MMAEKCPEEIKECISEQGLCARTATRPLKRRHNDRRALNPAPPVMKYSFGPLQIISVVDR